MSILTISQSILFSPLSPPFPARLSKRSNWAISLGITLSQVPPRNVWQELELGHFSIYYLLSGYAKRQTGLFFIYYLL